MLAFIDRETLIPADHPLRTIKHLADAALLEQSPSVPARGCGAELESKVAPARAVFFASGLFQPQAAVAGGGDFILGGDHIESCNIRVVMRT